MTKLVGRAGPIDLIDWDLAGLGQGDIDKATETPTQFVLNDTIDGQVYTFTGKNFTYDAHGVTGGVLNSLSIETAGVLTYTLSAMKVDIVAMRSIVHDQDLVGLENLLFGGDDNFRGSNQADGLRSMGGNDAINGAKGNDTIIGGAGSDLLTGGKGSDIFAFTAITDSTSEATDTITDLEARDRIDLSAIDANSRKDGDQAFKLVSAFTHHAGEAVLSYDAGTERTSLMLDVDGDGAADGLIYLAGDQTEFTRFAL